MGDIPVTVGPNFQTYAGNYDNRIDFDRYLLKYKVEKLLELRPQLGACLELGCATGLMTRDLLKASTWLDIVDASPEYVDQVKRMIAEEFPDKAAASRSTLGMFEEFKPDRKYDTVVFSGVIPALEKPVDFLKLITPWFTPDGVIYITTHNGLSLHRRLGRVMGLIPDEHELSERDVKLFGHRKVYDAVTLVADVAAAGYRIIDSGAVYLKPLPNAEMEKLPPAMIEGFNQLGKTMPAEYNAELYILARPV